MAPKNEQFHNAKEAEARLESLIIEEKDLSEIDLMTVLENFQASEKGTDSTPSSCPATAKLLKKSKKLEG